MNKIIANPSNTKAVLEAYNLYAKKNYGQNFLVEVGIVDKIARKSIPNKQTTVIEIGPGIGALTQCLANYAKQVVAFEIDERLLPVLKDTLSDKDNVEILHQNFLEVDLERFCHAYENLVVAANLPYYITTPLLFKIFESKTPITQITAMMQKEVADRFGAKVNTKNYNALSIIAQYHYDIKIIMKVPASVFNPRPKVDSAVVQFIYKENHLVDNEQAFFKLIKGCFKQRRKTMLNNLGEYLQDKQRAKEALEKAKIEHNYRAESLEVERFAALFEAMQ
ncbi:MAG: 16S rRNA (adenine(1518)-N(6)/adenine(1519)-N(6))-dimethyltransferase RsmA [Breznakia sp.]